MHVKKKKKKKIGQAWRQSGPKRRLYSLFWSWSSCLIVDFFPENQLASLNFCLGFSRNSVQNYIFLGILENIHRLASGFSLKRWKKINFEFKIQSWRCSQVYLAIFLSASVLLNFLLCWL